MKYTCQIEIDSPIDRVVELWSNEANFIHWQDGFQSITLLEGVKDSVGSKSKIILEDKRRIELIETIMVNNLPNEKTALYEHKHMTNTQKTQFTSIDETRTLYTSEVEYIHLKGWMLKLMAKLFPGKFKQQSQKWMDQFRIFVEQKVSQ